MKLSKWFYKCFLSHPLHSVLSYIKCNKDVDVKSSTLDML